MTGTGAFAGAALRAAATGVGATAAAFAALIAAQRFFVPATIARLPAALIFRLAGAVGSLSRDDLPLIERRRRCRSDLNE